jgi:SOS-response transcriptional repressor LexA
MNATVLTRCFIMRREVRMLDWMTASIPHRSSMGAVSPGSAVAARRRALDLTVDDVVNLTKGVINQKLLSRLENDHVSVAQLRVNKLSALLAALRWTVAELEGATGVSLNEGIPGTESYVPSLRLPVLGTVSAGLRDASQSMSEPIDYITLDPHAAGLRGRPHDRLVVLEVNGDSMMSESVQRSIPHGAQVVIELGGVPVDNDIVAAWLPEFETAVLKRYREHGAVLRSNNPTGPVFRLNDTEIDVRGVVRWVQFKPA